MSLFGRARTSGRSDGYELADAYVGLRAQVLSLTEQRLGIADAPILALLMETGYEGAVATLVAVADGATSLYFSNGGGIIGAGEHAQVAAASRLWLEMCATNFGLLPTCDNDVPPPSGEGVTQFVAVTPDGLRSAVATEDELGKRGHVLSPLFYAGQDVITQIRLTAPKT